MSQKLEKDFLTSRPKQGHGAPDLHGWVRNHGLDCWAIGIPKSL